jgi:two-component system, OmpR family, sensor histidine kinase KdpD
MRRRAPLAAAKAAVDGLRCADLQLSDSDRGELLAAADESLDRLARLAVSLPGGRPATDDVPVMA